MAKNNGIATKEEQILENKKFNIIFATQIIALTIIIGVFIFNLGKLELINNTLNLANYINVDSQVWFRTELTKEYENNLPTKIDNMLYDLKQAQITLNLGNETGVDESTKHITALQLSWEELKNEVISLRNDDNANNKIIEISNEFYIQVSELSNEINNDFNTQSKHIAFLQIVIIIILITIAMVTVRKFVKDFHIVEKGNELYQLAYIDVATGVSNKTKCEELLKINVDSSKKSAFIIYDLNDLKKINDDFGHIEGDNYIAIFANILKQTATNFKTEPFIGRFGGDEFIVLFSDVLKSEPQDFLKIVQQNIENSNKTQKIKLSTAHGLALSDKFDDINTNMDLLRHADRLMYAEKYKMKTT